MIKKILLIDNNPVIITILRSALEKEGYDVLTASDGLTAFDILQNHVPDIIFLDLIMPNINGEQLSRIIYGMESLRNTPVILISGVAAEAGKHCDIKGIDGCIAKGPNLSKFVLNIVKQLDAGSYQKSSKVAGCDEVHPREVSQELLITNLHLKIVLQNMNEGMVEITRENRIIFANPAMSDLVNLPEEQLLAMDFTELFSGKEKDKIIELLAHVTDTPVVTDVAETLLLNGNDVTLQLIPVLDKYSHTNIIILRDISAKKAAEKKILDVKDYLASVLASVQTGIFIIDAETRKVIDANPVALEMFAESKSNLTGLLCHDTICTFKHGECSIIDHGEDKHKTVQTLIDSNGAKMYVLKTATSCTINGKKYIIENLVDITEQKNLEEKLHTQSITDDLTGLLNRRGFLMMTRKQLKIADRSQKPLHLLFADVDNLKSINDNFGHDAGDRTLVEASKILSSFRSSDIVGRLGGDEFAILVIGDEADNSKSHIEKRFNDLLTEANTGFEDDFKLSISFGTVVYEPANPCTIEDLIARADELMYFCKKEKQSV
jgi:diguanylate cyclase (GGDEF)-like protein/PAS domain S-box-containing protein